MMRASWSSSFRSRGPFTGTPPGNVGCGCIRLASWCHRARLPHARPRQARSAPRERLTTVSELMPLLQLISKGTLWSFAFRLPQPFRPRVMGRQSSSAQPLYLDLLGHPRPATRPWSGLRPWFHQRLPQPRPGPVLQQAGRLARARQVPARRRRGVHRVAVGGLRRHGTGVRAGTVPTTGSWRPAWDGGHGCAPPPPPP